MQNEYDKYVELKTVVAMFLDQYDKSYADFDKCWVLSFRGLVDLRFNFSAEPVSVRLPVEGNKTVRLPADYISWSKIGVLNNNGEVSTLKINNGLSIYKDSNPNRTSQLTPDIQSALPLLSSSPFYLNYFYNSQYVTLYGIGGGLIQYGECRVDEENRVIVLSPDFSYDSVILEYISSPKKNGDYTIPTALQEALIAFLEWKTRLNTEQNYYARCIEARRRLPGKKATLQTINQVIREAHGFKLKA